MKLLFCPLRGINREILAAACILFFSISTNASISLTFINQTSLPSTVKVLTGQFANTCATEIPFGIDAFTLPYSEKVFYESKITIMCGGAILPDNPCRAEFYVGGEIGDQICDEAMGEKSVGSATLYADGHIEIDTIKNNEYDIAVNGNKVTLRKISLPRSITK